MQNPFEELKEEIRKVSQQIAELKEASFQPPPKRISFTEYCRREGISRPTAYKRIENKLVNSEMVGGRRFVINDGATVVKYQRATE